MRVLILGRKGIGGQEIQAEGTAAALRDEGLEVEVSDSFDADARDFDVVHVFSCQLPGPTRAWQRVARRHGKPLAFSTVWWSPEAVRMEMVRRGLAPAGSGGMGRVYQELKGHAKRRAMRPAFTEPDILLPNSYAEYGVLVAEFDVSKPYRVVPNAVELCFADVEADPSLTDVGVLCVGRLEMRKNQIGLLEALMGTDFPVTLVGAENPATSKHNALLRELAQRRGNVQLVPEMEDRRRLAQMMMASEAYVQPSYYETPGLAALEAGLCGANLAISHRGCTVEYFGDMVEYYDPDDHAGMLAAIERARAKPKDSRLAEHVLRNLTWKRAAEETIKAYEAIV